MHTLLISQPVPKMSPAWHPHQRPCAPQGWTAVSWFPSCLLTQWRRVLVSCQEDAAPPALWWATRNRNWHLYWAQIEGQISLRKNKNKKNQHMSVITLTQTKLTCADRWKWSKARINFLGARKGSEGEWVPVGVQRGPSLSHLPAASAWWLHAFSTLCLKCAFNTPT